jgi:peptidoglycan/LPS O-acetylase OafA/YrhL
VNKSPSKSNFRYDINALRALAVLSVVLYHFKVKGFGVGFIGVDIFFVISGYLMTQIIVNMLDNNSFSYIKFIYSRATRIWPALIGLILVLSLLGAVLLPPDDYKKFAESAIKALLFISNIEFAKGVGYFSSGIEERWFLHSWSLSVEWQFYCIYPLIVFAFYKVVKAVNFGGSERLNSKQLLNLILLILTLSSFFYSLYLTLIDQPKAFFSLPSRAWEMLVGGHVLLLKNTKPSLWVKQRASYFKCLSVALFAACVWLGRGGVWEAVWPGYLALIPVIATAIYILAEESNSFWSKLEANKITQSLGNWSYSIYLWHWPIVIAINFYGLAVVPKSIAFAGIILSLTLGYFSYRWVEQVFRTKNVSLHNLLKVMIPYGLSCTLVAVVVWTNGAVNRPNVISYPEEYSTALKLPGKYENSKLLPAQPLQTLTLNGSASQKVLLMGDSHAEHLYPWFVQNLKNASVTFAITVGCPPLPSLNRHDQGWYCDQSFQKIEHLILHNQFDVIVISGNWYSIDWDRPGLCAKRYSNCPELDVKQNRNYAINSMAQFLDTLIEKKIKIVIVKPTPYSPVAIGHVWKRYSMWGVTPPSTYIDKEWASNNGDMFLDAVVNRLKSKSNLITVDLRSPFCKRGTCHYFDANNVPIFWDDNHFSPGWILKNGTSLSVIDSFLNPISSF